MSQESSHKANLLSRWALGIAQGLIIAALGWFGKQQLGMHDQLNQLSWQMTAVNASTQQVQKNATAIDRLYYRVTDLEKRQAKDEAIRERAREASH